MRKYTLVLVLILLLLLTGCRKRNVEITLNYGSDEPLWLSEELINAEAVEGITSTYQKQINTFESGTNSFLIYYYVNKRIKSTNYVVTVKERDIELPLLYFQGDKYILLGTNDTLLPDYVKCVDEQTDCTITELENTVIEGVPGLYHIKYQATDEDGNKSEIRTLYIEIINQEMVFSSGTSTSTSETKIDDSIYYLLTMNHQEYIEEDESTMYLVEYKYGEKTFTKLEDNSRRSHGLLEVNDSIFTYGYEHGNKLNGNYKKEYTLDGTLLSTQRINFDKVDKDWEKFFFTNDMEIGMVYVEEGIFKVDIYNEELEEFETDTILDSIEIGLYYITNVNEDVLELLVYEHIEGQQWYLYKVEYNIETKEVNITQIGDGTQYVVDYRLFTQNNQTYVFTSSTNTTKWYISKIVGEEIIELSETPSNLSYTVFIDYEGDYVDVTWDEILHYGMLYQEKYYMRYSDKTKIYLEHYNHVSVHNENEILRLIGRYKNTEFEAIYKEQRGE